MSCPSDSAPKDGEDCFFCSGGINWDAHRIGWAVAGAAAAITALITVFSLTMQAINYRQPQAQKQVMRVLLMPPVYAIVSFFSYRYYQSYEYYLLAETAYESITLSAFLLLLMRLVEIQTDGLPMEEIIKGKDSKTDLAFPLNHWHFKPSKPYFLPTVTFSVLQYVVIRPLISIIGIICEYYNLLCPQKYSLHFAEGYLDVVDFISISVALYGLIVFYVLFKHELKGRNPLNKFLAIKLIVFFTFYQSFVFTVLQHYNVIKATSFWTADNVSDGLSALCTTIEMVVFSAYMAYAYRWTEYTRGTDRKHTGARLYFKAIWDTINMWDFCKELSTSFKFFRDYMLGKPGTRAVKKTELSQSESPRSQAGNDSIPMSSLETKSPTGQNGFRRTPSGRLLSDFVSPNGENGSSYQKLHEDAAQDTSGGEGRGKVYGFGSSFAAMTQRNPNLQVVSSTRPTQPQWGDSYGQQSPYSQQFPDPSQYHSSSPSRAAFPDPHPYAAQTSSGTHQSYMQQQQQLPSPQDSTQQSYQSDPSSHLSPTAPPTAFPSPHPMQMQQPNSATLQAPTVSRTSSSVGSSHYVTPAETPGEYSSTQHSSGDPWADGIHSRDPQDPTMLRSRSDNGQRPQSGYGIPGNPKLY